MEIKNAFFVYFSPTETTKRVLHKMSEQIGAPHTFHDITPFHCQYQKLFLERDDLLVIGIPVYSGRVPKTFVERLAYLEGKETPTVLVATYGNRDYDDALLELKNLLMQKGFVPMAAAAFVTEHNIYRALASGRPDENDMTDIALFSKRAAELLMNISSAASYNLRVRGNQQYRDYILTPMQPHSTNKCNQCGACAKRCPAGAIPLDRPYITDKEKCIRCMGCIRGCPQQARKLSLLQKFGARMHLSKYAERKEHEYFFVEEKLG